MTDAAPSTEGEAGSSAAAAPAAAGAAGAPSASGLKDPRQLAEAVLVKMLAIYEQLANANMLLSVPQVWLGCQPFLGGHCWLAIVVVCWSFKQPFLGIRVNVCSRMTLTVASPCV
jgi:hypothetical protein